MNARNDEEAIIEVDEVLSAEPIGEAMVSDVVVAVRGYVVASEMVEDDTHQPVEMSIIETGESDELSDTAEDIETLEIDDPVVAQEMAEDESDYVEVVADFDDTPDEILPHQNGQLKSVIECMLFVATDPLSAKQLADTLEIEEAAVEEAVNLLESSLEHAGGLQLMRVAGGYQLCTRPEYADYCALILQPAKKRLSKAALETLAVVAYRQPCTMPEVEAVRGVAVNGVVKTLMERGLVKEAGHKQTAGRPALYATTPEFLEYFGLNDVSELPDIDLMAVEEVHALEAQRELFISTTHQDAPESAESNAASDEE